jgi:hypothetical protein
VYRSEPPFAPRDQAPAADGPSSASPELSGPEGNERLTATTGAVLLILFAAEGLTLLSVSRLLYWHYLIGFILVGPICVKLASTIYRFTRYYTGDSAYRRKGPPQLLLRVLGPFVALSTIAVMVTGVLLAIDGTSPRISVAGVGSVAGLGGVTLLLLHKLSFIAWAGVMTIHVLAYLWRLPRLIAADITPSSRGGRAAHSAARAAAHRVAGRGLRWSITLLALGAGTILALACVHLATYWSR